MAHDSHNEHDIDGLRKQIAMDSETIERIRNAAIARDVALEVARQALEIYGDHAGDCPLCGQLPETETQKCMCDYGKALDQITQVLGDKEGK